MKPTIKQLREFWDYCEKHSMNCQDVNCELWYAFNHFEELNKQRLKK